MFTQMVCDTLTPVANDDDGCDAPNGFGSSYRLDVVGGQEYLIEWDDRWGADAFDWELTGPTYASNRWKLVRCNSR